MRCYLSSMMLKFPFATMARRSMNFPEAVITWRPMSIRSGETSERSSTKTCSRVASDSSCEVGSCLSLRLVGAPDSELYRHVVFFMQRLLESGWSREAVGLGFLRYGGLSATLGGQIEPIASHWEACCPCGSKNIRTARSRTFWRHFLLLCMNPSSQEVEWCAPGFT